MAKEKELRIEDGEKEEMENVAILNWLDANFPENMDEREINIQAADIARVEICKKFNMAIEEPETIIAFFSITFDSLKEVLEEAKNKKVTKRNSKEDDGYYIDFDINVGDRFIIGFTDSDNTDNEKIGSFTPHMYHLDSNLRQFDPDDDEVDSIILASQWFVENIKERPKFIKEVGTKTSRRLAEEIDMHFNEEIPELVIAMFCTAYDMIIGYLKIAFSERYKEDNIDTYELNVNVMNAFDCIIRKDQNGDLKVGLKPSVSTKQETKNDGQATAINE